jgi:hypothetical protein
LNTSDREFVQYVGNADFHDGTIIDIRHDAEAIRVRVRGASKKVYIAEFPVGKIIRINRPEGMLLYSLSELRTDPPLRRFAFANWDEEDDAALEIEAETLIVHNESTLT